MRPFLIIDNFAGGGGASTGIEAAIGRSVDIAINHDPEAIAMHKANHPGTKHYCQDVWEVDPIEATGGLPVALAWFSPDCKHFSKAKGGKPRENKIRDLAWVVHRWVRALGELHQPRVIMLENVEEFRTWGPLLPDGKPCPDRKGETFADWVQQLRDAGYDVQWRELKACDFGAPTSRKRLYLIARCDGEAIIWPAPTHGAGKPAAWRVAADIIDFTLPCPSIFERKRFPVEKTCRRIARGIQKFVIDAPRPFIVPITHSGGMARVHSIDEPLRTITTANRGELALAMPPLIQVGYGEAKGQAPRVLEPKKPLGTVTAGGNNFALISAFMAQHNGGPRNQSISGRDLTEPTSTITGRSPQQQLVTSNLIKLQRHNLGSSVETPVDTILAGGLHFAEVRAFLIKYYGNEESGHGMTSPIGAVKTRDRFGAITCAVDGADYAIADIGMRMLSPRELYRAQSFPDDYIIDTPFNGKPMTKTAATRMCGNSVPPVMPAVLVRANLPWLCDAERAGA